MQGTLLVLEEKEYFLKFTLNSLRILEKEHGIKLTELSENIDMETIQLILFLGLNKFHKELTFEEVGDMVDVANIQPVVDALTKALGGLPQ